MCPNYLALGYQGLHVKQAKKITVWGRTYYLLNCIFTCAVVIIIKTLYESPHDELLKKFNKIFKSWMFSHVLYFLFQLFEFFFASRKKQGSF